MLKFLKIRNVKNPEREVGNAGIDLFVPSFTKELKESCKCIFDIDSQGKECIAVPPHKQVCIPSGIKAHISINKTLGLLGLEMDLFAENKSSIATKKFLDVSAVEIDPNYQGEIHISLTNTSDEYIYIYEGEKIIQLVPRIYIAEKIKVFDGNEILEEEFYKDFKYYNRGIGAFGSTNS